ncbi:hypothetical protein [Rhodopila sp.]|uniref:hypothetical protein n=1 Tax=Rhodopila sp. TaxID=2480087 RepID=UPI003D0A67FB
MIRALSVALLLAGCAAPVKTPVTEIIPREVLSCPEGRAVPPTPAKPRTIEAISGWGNRNERALRSTLVALKECNRRRDEAVRLLKQR